MVFRVNLLLDIVMDNFFGEITRRLRCIRWNYICAEARLNEGFCRILLWRIAFATQCALL